MKKLLLILAAIAYIAISCEDKPNTLTGGDEPETEQPGTNPADSSSNPEQPSEPEDTIAYNADTGKITVIDAAGWATFIYNVSSDDVDFDASINSIFKHYTITLKDGSTPQWIGTNCYFQEPYSQDTGSIMGIQSGIIIDSLKNGNYFAITWSFWTNSSWGPNYHNPEFKGIYHDIVLTDQHNSEMIEITDSIMAAWDSANNLSFVKY